VAARFRIAATSYAIGNALGFTIVSFCLVPLTDYFGYYAPRDEWI
jgi:hypothetical protein